MIQTYKESIQEIALRINQRAQRLQREQEVQEVSSKGNFIKLKNGLTPKQNRFKDKIIEQIATTGNINGTQAAIEVYDTKDRAVAKDIAQENLSKPSIREQIEIAMESKGLTPSSIMDNLKKIAVNTPEKVSGEVYLKANIEMLKLWGAYPGSKSMHMNLNLSGKIGTMGYDEAQAALDEIEGNVGEMGKDTKNY